MKMSELGDALRKLRVHSKLTPEEVQRGYKRVTQDLFAERMGWRNAPHVSEIEKGWRVPEAETISRWVRACGGTMNDDYYLRGLAGYLPPTHLPDINQILAVLKQIDHDSVSKHPYPSYIVDYRNWVWTFNNVCQIYFDHNEGLIHDLVGRPVGLFHLMFDPRLPVRQKLTDTDGFFVRQVTLFKMMNMKRQHEPFFKNYAEEIGRTLLPPQAQEFKRVWNSTKAALDGTDPMHRETLNVCFSLDTEISFNIFAENIYNFQDLFAVIRLEPDKDHTTAENLAKLEAMCAPHRGKPSACLWDVIDPTEFIKQYHGE
jgi:transcriptional regulator with XRE-family HTH domain